MNASQRELAHREQDGLEVTLFWNPRSNEVSVEVVDQRDESSFRLPVAGARALDAFYHPYSYALAADPAADIASMKSAQGDLATVWTASMTRMVDVMTRRGS